MIFYWLYKLSLIKEILLNNDIPFLVWLTFLYMQCKKGTRQRFAAPLIPFGLLIMLCGEGKQSNIFLFFLKMHNIFYTTFCQSGNTWSVTICDFKDLIFLGFLTPCLSFTLLSIYSLPGWPSSIFILCSDRKAPDNMLPHHWFHLVCR